MPELITVTDDRGNLLLVGDDANEPEPGSVALSDGVFGTAWQRHFSDGKWHRTGGGKPITWAMLCAKRNVVLVYDADARVAVTA